MSEINKLMNDINWMVSLFVAIPLSIAGNLLTPSFQNWRARRSKKTATVRIKELEHQLEEISLYSTNYDKLNGYLLASTLSVILLFSIPGAISNFTSIMLVTPLMNVDFNQIYGLMNGIFGSLFNLLAIIRAQRALQIYQRAREFANYKAETESTIEQLRASTG